MNKQQINAIEELKKAHQNLEKTGLALFLHESTGLVCKASDYEKYKDDIEVLVSDENADKYIYLNDVYIENYNA